MGPTQFSKWQFHCDYDATLAAYKLVTTSGPQSCGRNGCKNSVLARSVIYPPAFLELLHALGIDSQKEAEVYHLNRISAGVHEYGGWFHFVGHLDNEVDFKEDLAPGFYVWFTRYSAPCLSELAGRPLVQVKFYSKNVPWVLDEPEQV